MEDKSPEALILALEKGMEIESIVAAALKVRRGPGKETLRACLEISIPVTHNALIVGRT